MALLAMIIPILMLGVVLALGRYEELLLPEERDEAGPATVPAPLRPASSPTSSATSSPGPAGTPAPSP
ncbi:hypothetical protein [Streptomyces dysideae]|uniref:hypothetical protein n=1 Tax=Streptomyces dysideae TaxID=909626 RepID=UPI00099E7530|nr:hypothetical protein [Streptomyces dysideae]